MSASVLRKDQVEGYDVILYHDEPEEAAADGRGLGQYYRTLDEAVRGIRERLNSYWQMGTVHKGVWTSAVPGVRPSSFEVDENDRPWLVGPDWIDR